ncbi:MAG: guanylate kinase [Clostridia bacterium]|nr:guanylate kinase [Clostridia bacterium]
MNQKGLLVIISGPAGSGKGTIVSRLRELAPFDFSVSATTRKPRPGELHGVHYYFVDKADFESKIEQGEMLEYAQYVGNYYGTPKKPVEDALAEGKNIILDIEVKGALQVKEKMPEAIMIYVLPPDYETLLARIRGRGTETEEVIQKRMNEAKNEIKTFPRYDYVVINRDGGVDRAAQDVLTILSAEKMRTLRNADIPENFFR